MNAIDWLSGYSSGAGGAMLEIYHVPSGQKVEFPAIITNFVDSVMCSWNSESVYGRMDSIPTFKQTERKISLGWTAVARSLNDAEANMANVSKLMSFCYPSYSSAGILAASPLLKIRYINWIQKNDGAGEGGQFNYGALKDRGLTGYIGGFQFAPNLDAAVIDYRKDGALAALYPQQLDCSCEFTVLHTHQLGWDQSTKEPRDGFENFPYGAQSDGLLGRHTPISDDLNRGFYNSHKNAYLKRTGGVRGNPEGLGQAHLPLPPADPSTLGIPLNTTEEIQAANEMQAGMQGWGWGDK